MNRTDPVGRIQSIQFARGAHVPHRYDGGRFFPIRVQRSIVGPMQDVAAVVIRPGGNHVAAVAAVDQLLYVGDLLKTGPDTLMAIEFLIGGRASIGRDSCMEIVNERGIADGDHSWMHILRSIGHRGPRYTGPLEIQTNGGVFGIKG